MTQYDPAGSISLLTGATDPNGDPITVRKINGVNVDWATNPQTVTLTVGTAKVWQNGAVKYDDGGATTSHPVADVTQANGSFTYTLWDGSLESPTYTATVALIGAPFVDVFSQVEGLRYKATPNGRTSTNPLKVPLVDPWPSGGSYSATYKTLTLNTSLDVLEDWDFRNVTVKLGSNVVIKTLRQCLFGETSPQNLNYYLHGSSGAKILTLEYCTFTGPNHHDGAGTAINHTTVGSGATVSSFEILLNRYCRFEKLTSDAIKFAGANNRNGQRIEWCYFGPPRNLSMVPVLWDVATSYPLGKLVTYGKYNFESKVANNLGNTPPSTVSSDTFWRVVNPHADALTGVASVVRTSIRFCLFDWTNDPVGVDGPFADQSGVNNAYRFSRNTGTDHLMNAILVDTCIAYHGQFNSLPIDANNNGLGNWTGPIEFVNCRMTQNKGGAYFHPGTNGNVAQWINMLHSTTLATVPGPTGSATTDITSAPVNTVAPSLTGTVAQGNNLTLDVGTWLGFPAPLYDCVVEESANGSTGWSDTGTLSTAATFALSAAMVGKYYRLGVVAHNSKGTAARVNSAVVGPVA